MLQVSTMEIKSPNHGFNHIGVHLARDVLESFQLAVFWVFVDLRVVVELVLLDMIRFDVIGEGRRKLTVFFGKNVFVDFLQDPFPVQIRITNDIGPTYVQLAFITIWFL